jgi:hypothetical protein
MNSYGHLCSSKDSVAGSLELILGGQEKLLAR